MTSVRFLVDFVLMLILLAFNMKALACFLEFKKEWWRKLLAYLSCWIVMGNVLYIGDKTNLPIGLGCFIFGMWIACEGSAMRKLTVSTMVSSMIMAYCALADNWAERLFAEVLIYIEGRAIFAVLFYLAAKRFGPPKDYDLTASMWRLLFLLSLTPLGIVAAVVMLPSPYWDSMTEMKLHFVLLCIALFSFAGLLWTISVLAKQKQMEEEVLFAKINQNYYDTMEQQQFEVRRLRHDLANHLQTLSALSGEKREEYIQELLANESITKTLNYCKDATVNAVMTAKENRLRRLGIPFHWLLDIPTELPFEKSDICAVFANALDNAAEACERQMNMNSGNPAEAGVYLESRLKKGIFVLSVKNPYQESEAEKQADGLFSTKKADAKNHGFGLRSIREAARRYGGEMEIQTENGWFELFVYFPAGVKREEH